MKKLRYLLVIVFASLFMYACGSSGKEAAMESMQSMDTAGSADMNYMTEDAVVEMEEYMPEDGSSNKDSVDPNKGRKLIRNVSLDVETKEYDKLLVNLENEINAMGGYMESFNSYNGGYYDKSGRNADIVARIPAAKLDDFVNKVGEEANITNRSESVEDVTLRYVDMDAHKKMLQEEQERLLELLETAGSLEDIIVIESRLSEVRYQIESMESQLRTMDNQVDYSTVRIGINEVKELTPVVEKSTWDRISEGFTKSLKDIGNGFVEFFIGFIIYLPYIILMLAFALIILLVTLFIIKICSKPSKKAVNTQKQPSVIESYAAEKKEETKKQE